LFFHSLFGIVSTDNTDTYIPLLEREFDF